MSCAPCLGDTIGDCDASCPDPKQITIEAAISIGGFRLFEEWVIAGTADVTHWDNSGTLTPVAGGWSKTAWTAGEYLEIRHYLELPTPTGAPTHPFPDYSDASGSRLWSDRGVRIFRAKVNMSPAPAPPVHISTGDFNWEEINLFASSLAPQRLWTKPLWNNAVAWPMGSLVTKTGTSAGVYVAQEDIPIGAAAPGILAEWLPWAVLANLDQQSATARLFRNWNETVDWDLPDGVSDTSGGFGALTITPSTGSATRTVNRLSWISAQGAEVGPSGGDIPDSHFHFWWFMFPPLRPGRFVEEAFPPGYGFPSPGSSRYVLDFYSRTDTKIEMGFKLVMRAGADQSPTNYLTQTYELTDEFDPDDEWVLRAEEALGLADFTGLTNMKHHTVALNGDETVTITETASVAGSTAIRGDHVLQKLLKTVVGDYCLTFTPDPSGADECTDGHVDVCTDLEIDPPATDGEIAVSNPCTCAP